MASVDFRNSPAAGSDSLKSLTLGLCRKPIIFEGELAEIQILHVYSLPNADSLFFPIHGLKLNA